MESPESLHRILHGPRTRRASGAPTPTCKTHVRPADRELVSQCAGAVGVANSWQVPFRRAALGTARESQVTHIRHEVTRLATSGCATTMPLGHPMLQKAIANDDTQRHRSHRPDSVYSYFVFRSHHPSPCPSSFDAGRRRSRVQPLMGGIELVIPSQI